MDDRPRCGAHSRRTGKPCKNPPLKGGATRCRMHSGKHQIRQAGSPDNGGRPPSSGIYARHLRDPEMLSDYGAARLGSLDDELRVAKAYLAWSIRMHQENPKGGIAVSVSRPGDGGPGALRIRSYADIVGELTDRVRRLEITRAKLLAIIQHPEERPEDFEAWLKSTRSTA